MTSTLKKGQSVPQILEAIRGYEYRYAAEYGLQSGLRAALEAKGFIVELERRVFGGRIDLYVPHSQTVGIEVKTAGTAAEVARQLRRYAGGGDLDALILVSNRVRHQGIEKQSFKIPVHVEVLVGGGL